MTDRHSDVGRAEDNIVRLRELARREPGRYFAPLALALVDLARGLSEIGERSGAMAAVDEAIVIGRNAVSEHADPGVDRASSLSSLSVALQVRFEMSGDLDSLNEAITLLRQSLAEGQSIEGDRTALLSNLGNALRMRFERSGVTADLAEALKLQRLAVAEASADDQDRTALLSNLGTALRLWFEVTGDVDSLDEAVALLRQAVTVTQPGNPNWARRLSNLGAALRARFERTGEQTDLAEAEALLRHAVDVAQPHSADYPMLLSNHADSLRDLAQVLNDQEIWERAGAEFAAVLKTRERVLGPDHPDTLASRNNLASVLAQQGRLAEAESAFQAVLASRRVVLGPEHPDTLASQALLTGIHDSLAKASAIATPHGEGSPGVGRVILAIDIAAFTDRKYTDANRLALRHAFYEVLIRSLAEASISRDASAFEDRGDGALVLISPTVPKSSVARIPEYMRIALRRHNAASPETRLRLRLSIDAGEVFTDAYGFVGDTILHAFRLLDSTPLRKRFAQSDSDVAVIVSDWVYREVIRHDATAQPDAYRKVSTRVKGRVIQGWIWTPADHKHTGTGEQAHQPPVAISTTGNDTSLELVDALLAIPSVADESGRRLLIRLLGQKLTSTIPNEGRARQQVIAIVRTCLARQNGLETLLATVRTLEPDTMSRRNWETAVTRILGSPVDTAQESLCLLPPRQERYSRTRQPVLRS